MKTSFAAAAVISVLFSGGCSQQESPTSPTSGSSALQPSVAGNMDISGSPASADSVPFKGDLEGTQVFTPPNQVTGSASGAATFLGQFTVQLPHTVDLATRTGRGTFTFTAANGDTLTATFEGLASGTSPIISIVEDATVTGGTGRFAGATGTFTVRRTFNQATGVTIGTFEGTLSAVGAGQR